ncbi:energy-coupling factor transporter transmembrane protein EcfT [Mammaliicoccus fleurettii]|uniref:energy-coupling factor transporter transmembrane component T family protein n=1 Tax=Mammaliicoccus fleurettii TaxID=150056 RepID=UPI002DBB5266|nr:energy-coupling factor transporter transmembrane component T [Mammaliicoccus fleurettii]MEB7805317.1 energy-coupling factor transporter transmembrane protein EcfT [Mammaliicoccus fleurettii]
MLTNWKKYSTFIDDVNILTKLLLGIVLFFFAIFIHDFDFMIYLTLIMFIYLIIMSGVKWLPLLIIIMITLFFGFTSSLFMIFYGEGDNTIFQLGIIHITNESLLRGLHVTMRTLVISFYGMVIPFTSQIIFVFYSFMQHLKLKPKIAYAFMASIRLIPIMFSSFMQLRQSLKMRYSVIDKSNRKGLKWVNHLLIPTLSQSIRKSHRLAVAMEAKGFTNQKRTYYYKVPITMKDLYFVLMTILLVVVAYLLSIYIPITSISDIR